MTTQTMIIQFLRTKGSPSSGGEVMSRSAGARQRHDMFDYFGLVGHPGIPSHTLDSSALAGPASFLSFMLIFRQIVYQ